MYKITFTMLSESICFTDLPQFDAMLAYCYVQDTLGHVPQKLSYTQDELIDFEEVLPLRYDSSHLARASQMFFDKEQHEEWVTSIKKRWANEYDHIVNFGKKKREVNVSRGEFKSYDMPRVVHALKRVWFYFESDNVQEVERLISQHLRGIGKEVNIGFGVFKSFEITETAELSFDTHLLRPMPKDLVSKEQVANSEAQGYLVATQYKAYKPPYWLPTNQVLSLVAL
jgi:CRISPR type IV-associated protein Csf3